MKMLKAVNTKSVVLINCRKINHQQENTFMVCKQLNGPVLKSLKPKRSWLKLEKKLAGPGSGQNCFETGRARAEFFQILFFKFFTAIFLHHLATPASVCIIKQHYTEKNASQNQQKFS